MVFSLPGLTDILPVTSGSISHYGCGVINLPKNFVVYSAPSEASKVLKIVDYSDNKQSPDMSYIPSYENISVAFSPANSISLVVVETNEENGWYEVYYDQKTGKTGWVKNMNQDAFKTWKDVFYLWGKKYGLYIFKDVQDDKKVLYSQPGGEGQRLEDITYAKYINFSMVQGNWMLVTVLDLGCKAKIGWMQWRTDDGKLLMFPTFKN